MSLPLHVLFALQLNVYLNRKFPGKSLSVDGDGSSGATNTSSAAANVSTASEINSDEPPQIDSVNSQYPVTNAAVDGLNLGFDTGNNFTTDGGTDRLCVSCP